jgi:hypothetical protein
VWALLALSNRKDWMVNAKTRRGYLLLADCYHLCCASRSVVGQATERDLNEMPCMVKLEGGNL